MCRCACALYVSTHIHAPHPPPLPALGFLVSSGGGSGAFPSPTYLSSSTAAHLLPAQPPLLTSLPGAPTARQRRRLQFEAVLRREAEPKRWEHKGSCCACARGWPRPEEGAELRMRMRGGKRRLYPPARPKSGSAHAQEGSCLSQRVTVADCGLCASEERRLAQVEAPLCLGGCLARGSPSLPPAALSSASHRPPLWPVKQDSVL